MLLDDYFSFIFTNVFKINRRVDLWQYSCDILWPFHNYDILWVARQIPNAFGDFLIVVCPVQIKMVQFAINPLDCKSWADNRFRDAETLGDSFGKLRFAAAEITGESDKFAAAK